MQDNGMIPYGKQDIRSQDIQAVVDVLESDYLTQGSAVPAFEGALSQYAGAGHAVCVNSATSALHIACLALDLQPGDYLWTSPISFVASANCGLYCGAKVDFVDIDSSTFNLCPKALSKKLADAEKEGKLPKVVVAVHLGGLSCDMQAIKMLADQYGFAIIEDASHSIGATYQDENVGCCRYSDIAVFSFHPVKIITSGEGGAALTNNSALYKRMMDLRCHGITRQTQDMTKAAEGPWYYQQLDLGFNYRLSDIHAALGLSQLSRLDKYIRKRHDIMGEYRTLLNGTSFQLQSETPEAKSSYHLCLVQLPCTQQRADVFAKMRHQGIGVNVHYIPIHLQPYYQALGFSKRQFPKAEAYYDAALTLPLHVGLSNNDIHFIVNTLKSAVLVN